MPEWADAIRARLASLQLAPTREAEIVEELSQHLDDRYHELIAGGASPDEAQRVALRSITSSTALAQHLTPLRQAQAPPPITPGATSGQVLGDLRQDLSHALRLFVRQRGFAAAVILTLALGIGANTAIFSVVYAALLQPLPYENPEQLYSVEIVIPGRTGDVPSLPVRVQDYLEWSTAETAFSSVAALTPSEWNLTGDGEPQRVGAARVSTNFFTALGVPPAHGRTFLPEEEQPGRDRVAIISDALWRSRYAANPAVLQSTIFLNGNSHVVVGIAPPTLLVPTGTALHTALPFAPRIDVWIPIAPTPRDLEGENWNHGLIVRLKTGESLERGRVQLQHMLNASLRAVTPDMKTEFQTRMVPIREIYSGKIRLRLLLVFGAAGLLLLAACTNVANLYLGRFASRSQEFAIRASLGASRSRLVSQIVIESTLLAVIGGVVGIAAAYLGVGILLAQGPNDVRVLGDGDPRLPVLIVSVLVSIACGVLCGLLPALQTYRKDARSVLQESERGNAGGRAAATRQLLVGVEVALSTVLLASAALLLHSFVRVAQADRGYAIEHVLAFDLTPAGPRYSTPAGRAAYYQELMTEVRAVPGVIAAGAVASLPALGESNTQVVFLPGDAGTRDITLKRPVTGIRNATPGYFAASGSTLRAGRFFSEQDTTLVVVIGESLARRLWPNDAASAAVGRQIRLASVDAADSTVVGVVQDVKPGAVDRDLPPQLYRPHHQASSGRMFVVVRTSQDPTTLAASLREVVKRRDATVPIAAMRTMQEIVSAALAQRRFQMMLTGLFGVVALMLGAVGVYGVVSYSVTRRTRDIGVRLALGATSRDVLTWVFSHGMRPVIAGLVIGLIGAASLAQTLRHLLYGVGPLDPLALGSVALTLLVTAAIACYLPARRAATLDPLLALRVD
jgi:putative ABC transport system permease protein